jgi:hypothetical protein
MTPGPIENEAGPLPPFAWFRTGGGQSPHIDNVYLRTYDGYFCHQSPEPPHAQMSALQAAGWFS